MTELIITIHSWTKVDDEANVGVGLVVLAGDLGGAPDPGCEFTANASPKNTGKGLK